MTAIMTVLVLDGTTWDKAEGCLHISRKAISCRRNGAIGMMTVWYQERASRMEAVMLS